MEFCPKCLGHGRIAMESVGGESRWDEPHKFPGGPADRPEPGTVAHWFVGCDWCDGSGLRLRSGKTGLAGLDRIMPWRERITRYQPSPPKVAERPDSIPR